ncbi:MAG: hypothetical protein RIR00_205 [Pseudomonadota bacterium]|jgi:DNA-binding transcriptional LysR family regulator
MSLSLAKLPALENLRGFVAVGRRMSITLAAQDLFLTQSAVSRQIQGLEAQLGLRLFERGHRALQFTVAGAELFRLADGLLLQLQDGLGRLQDAARQRPVTLTASIGFVGLWLLPRLGDWQARHPDIELRLSADNGRVDLRQEGVDLAIRYAAAESLPAEAECLFAEQLAVVAHPALATAGLDLARLGQSVLLEFEQQHQPWLSWQTWLDSQGWSGARPRAMLRFNQYDQLIHAASAGQGLALGRLPLIAEPLADGRLARVALAQPGPPCGHRYALLCNPAAARPEVQAVIAWLREQAGATLARMVALAG